MSPWCLLSAGLAGLVLWLRSERERRTLLQELDAKAALLEQIGRSARVGGWAVEVETMQPSWSDEVFRIHEVEIGQQPGIEEAIEFYAPASRPVISAAVQEAIETGKPYDLELAIITARGRQIWVRARGFADFEGGKCKRLWGTFQDITNQRSLADRFELAQRAAGAGLWDWDVKAGTFTTNPIFHSMLGEAVLQGDLPLGYFGERVHPDDADSVWEAVRRAHEDPEEPYDIEFRMRCVDGSYRWVRSMGRVVLRDSDGNAARMIGQHVDVHATRLARAESERLNDQLTKQTSRASKLAARAEQASQAKTAFLANMSHEIRTPLTAIMGYTDVLRELGNLEDAPPERIHAVDTIKRAGEHLLTVINDILDISKIEAGKLTVERIETPLVDLLSEVDRLMRVRAEEKGIDLRTSLASAVPDRVIGDPTRLRQILLNLTGNAVKFTEQGGVEVRALVRATAPGHVPMLRIEVEDSGPGMTEEQADCLFELFTQADSSITRKHGGTGLGLAISKRLSEKMGGDVFLDWSTPGRGSCFVLEIPLASVGDAAMVESLGPAAAIPSEPIGSVLKKGQLSGRILLAEDGLDNQRLLSFFLEKAGAEVVVVGDGREALESFTSEEERPFDLVLTDIQMPEMDGYTLVRHLREAQAEVPVIALTAHAMAEDRRRCLEAGCDDFVTKPVDRKQLLECCSKWLRTPWLAQP